MKKNLLIPKPKIKISPKNVCNCTLLVLSVIFAKKKVNNFDSKKRNSKNNSVGWRRRRRKTKDFRGEGLRGENVCERRKIIRRKKENLGEEVRGVEERVRGFFTLHSSSTGTLHTISVSFYL